MQDRDLYRGRRLDNGEWAVGLLAPCRKYEGAEWEVGIADGISTSDTQHFSYKAVAPATIGQCTGLRDRNGALIFEGDIVRGCAGEIYHGISEFDSEFVVEGRFTQSVWTMLQCDTLEIIGSIHTTPELMEGNDDVR